MDFQLLVFTADPVKAGDVLSAGAAGVIVDWEFQDKHRRQLGANTEINRFGPADLKRVRGAVDGHLICRINGPNPGTRDEIESAIDSGADEIFLPMVRRVRDAEQFIRWIDGRAGASILIETRDAVLAAPQLGQLPLARVYVGLNDLAIDCGYPSIFSALELGVLDELRPHIGTSFGFGGLTVPEGGSPVACRLLMDELIRLRCSFTFLRRSFWRDVAERDVQLEIPRILGAMADARQRTVEQLMESRGRFQECLARIVGDQAGS